MLYNEKVKEEKEKDKGGKSTKPGKAALKGAGKVQQNQKMMTDLMGEDDYGDEDEEYGDEAGGTKKTKGKAKAQEEEYDFM